MATTENDSGVPLQSTDMPIWLAYGEQVKVALTAGGSLGPDEIVYICAPTSQPVPGGPWVLDAITNHYVGTVGDTLLEPDQPLYDPASNGSYTQWLAKYLSLVDPDPAITNSLNSRKAKYLQQLTGTQLASARELDSAITSQLAVWSEYNETQYNEGNDRISFQLWLSQNPGNPVDLAQQQYTTDYNAFEREYLGIYGDVGNEVLTMQQNMQNAFSKTTFFSGCNMPAMDQDVLNSFQTWLKDNQGGAAPSTGSGRRGSASSSASGSSTSGDPSSVYYQPDFSMEGLKDAAQGWALSWGKANQSWELDIQSGSSASWASLGHSQAQTSSGNNCWLFFSQTSEEQGKSTTKKLQFQDASQELDLTMNFAGLQTFSITPGQWDVPNIQALFPLRKDSPPDVYTGSIQISSILVGYGVGIEATFKQNAKSQASSFYSNVSESTTTGTRVFGINFGSDSSSSNSNSVSTSQTTYDSSSGKLVIPQVNSGVPVLLGLLGKKLPPNPSNPPAATNSAEA